jgi:hypothetical protein
MKKNLDAAEVLRELTELRKCIPEDGRMEKTLDAETILTKLAELRKRLPGIEQPRPSSQPSDHRTLFPDGVPVETEEDFEYAAVMEALESFADDVEIVREQAAARAVESALQIYYATEDLARDPANADLIPYVQAMREAYERDFGKPIPPKKPGDE